MKFCKLLVAFGMLLSGGLAQAQLTVAGSSFASWSGYDGQPVAQTGVLSSGIRGTLTALGAGTASFTYLGNESGNVNQFNFSVGSQVLTEGSAVGATIFGLIGPGSVGFSFRDVTTSSTFSNGSAAIVYVANGATTNYGTFNYIIGFNDNGSTDGDYDDFVVGVRFAAPIPEPETYAMLLAGLGLLGFAARRRKLKAAAAA